MFDQFHPAILTASAPGARQLDSVFQAGSISDFSRPSTAEGLAALNIDSFEGLTGCAMSDGAREQMLVAQHQALR